MYIKLVEKIKKFALLGQMKQLASLIPEHISIFLLVRNWRAVRIFKFLNIKGGTLWWKNLEKKSILMFDTSNEPP